jgi:uncharacterized protein YhaN
MKLLRLEIENFGKLSHYSLDLSGGLNVLCEKNGWGKSTLAVFIKAMLYGLPVSRRGSLDRNERKKYTPWQGGAFGGSMEFETEKGVFRAERFFGAKEANDEFRLFDLSTNKPSSAYSERLGEELFGINAEGFERTTYLSQRAIESDEGNASVTSKLTGLLDEVGDIDDFDVAMAIIDKSRKVYELKGGRGKIADIKNSINDKKEKLEKLTDLTPAQKELENQLRTIRADIRAREEELRGLRTNLTDVTERRLRREEYCRMQADLTSAEESRVAVLNTFSDHKIPTDRELEDAESLLKSCREQQSLLRDSQLSAEEADTYARLNARYPMGLPKNDYFDRVQADITELSSLYAKEKAMPSVSPSAEERAFSQSGIPSPQLLSQTLTQWDSAAREMEIAEIEAKNAPKPKRPSLLFPILLSLIGIGAVVAGVVISSLLIPLLTVGIALVAVGAVLLLVNLRRKNGSQIDPLQAKLAQARGRQESARQFLLEVLEKYSAVPENGDLRAALCDLSVRARYAHQSALTREKYESELRALRLEISALKNRLTESFVRLGFSDLPANPSSAIFSARSDAVELQRLANKKQRLQTTREGLEQTVLEKREALNRFFNRLSIRESNNPEGCLEQMKRLAQRHALLLEEIQKKRESVREYAQRYNIREDAPLPETESVTRLINEREGELNSIRQSEQDAKRRLDRMTEQTREIPELSDEIAHEKLLLDEAQENLKILTKTADFLSESKIALTTRYLSGIQEHFGHYLSRLESENTPKASMDTDFEISVIADGKSRELESFSRGSRDILGLCSRLALIRSMFAEGETPFLLLDDPFVNLDQDRLALAKELIDRLSEEYQILHFICHEGRK